MAISMSMNPQCLTGQLYLHPPYLFLPPHPCRLSSSPTSRPFRGVTTMAKQDPVAKRGPAFKLEDFASAGDLGFDRPLGIVKYPDPVLRAKNKPINTFDDALKRLVGEMFDVMYKTDGIGLSAPQVGINVQLMVFNAAGESGEGEEIVLVNPRVTKYSQKHTLINEGCLSFPGIYADVKRPDSVKIDARDISGSRFTMNLYGLAARVFQHEYDHLEGVLFFERMTENVLNGIRKDLQNLEMEYEAKTGSSSPERVDTFKRRTAGVGFGQL